MMKTVLLVLCIFLGISALSDSIPILAEERFSEVREELQGTPAATPPVSTQAPRAQIPQIPCDITAEKGVCLFNGKKILVPDAFPDGLLAKYTFDDGHGLDTSQNQMHGSSAVPAGPGRGSRGASARFSSGESAFTVADISSSPFAAANKQFTLTFWVFVSKPTGALTAPVAGTPDNNCTVARLGAAASPVFNVQLGAFSHSLVVSVHNGAAVLTSNATLQMSRWYHVTVRSTALAQNNQQLRLYVNGFLDSEMILTRVSASAASYGLLIGSAPEDTAQCRQLNLLIDDTQLFSTPLSSQFIEADAFQASGSVTPGSVQLACTNCAWTDAVAGCRRNFHVCYPNELRAGAVAAAHTLGWTQWNSVVWENDVTSAQAVHQGNPNDRKTGLCCR